MIRWGRFVGKGWVVTTGGGEMCRGWVRVELVVVEGGGGLWFDTGEVGERSEGARVWTHSATSVTEEV